MNPALQQIQEQLPEFIQIKDDETLLVTHSDWQGSRTDEITMKDIIEHYAYEAPSMKTVRRIGSIMGDWRPIRDLAQIILDVFKMINIEKLRKISKEYDLEPKF